MAEGKENLGSFEPKADFIPNGEAVAVLGSVIDVLSDPPNPGAKVEVAKAVVAGLSEDPTSLVTDSESNEDSLTFCELVSDDLFS